MKIRMTLDLDLADERLARLFPGDAAQAVAEELADEIAERIDRLLDAHGLTTRPTDVKLNVAQVGA